VERDVFCISRVFGAYSIIAAAASIHKAQGSTINHVFVTLILEVKLITTKRKAQSIKCRYIKGFRAYIQVIRYTRWTTSNFQIKIIKWKIHERG
jgi:hypothetical protein